MDNTIFTETNSNKPYFFTYKIDYFDEINYDYIDCKKDEALFLEIAALKKYSRGLKERAILHLLKHKEGEAKEFLSVFGRELFDEFLKLGYIKIHWGNKCCWMWSLIEKCESDYNEFYKGHPLNVILYLSDYFYTLQYKVKHFFQLILWIKKQ